MIAQYTQAGMAAENRRLAAPASVDSLPTSAMQEDHVSMSWGAARKLRTVVANLGRILAVEVVCAARGLEARAPFSPAPATAAVLAALRSRVPGVGEGGDRFVSPELALAEALVRDGTLRTAAEDVIGALA
jgi:histidine ammonia-lyase